MAEEEVTVTRVSLVVENRLLREALTRILNKKNDISVVAALAPSGETFSQIVAEAPHVLLLDVTGTSSPHANLLAALRKQIPTLKIVMVGMSEEKETFLASVRAGVSGYLLKEASAAEVVAAVRAVVQEQAVCPPKLCRALFAAMAEAGRLLPSAALRAQTGLTRREQQLITMLGSGFTNKEIAGQWNLSEQTVKNHVHRVLRKLGASDRLSAVELCRLRGWTA
jgi:DNA-binding NarL/FixJ family response regulator